MGVNFPKVSRIGKSLSISGNLLDVVHGFGKKLAKSSVKIYHTFCKMFTQACVSKQFKHDKESFEEMIEDSVDMFGRWFTTKLQLQKEDHQIVKLTQDSHHCLSELSLWLLATLGLYFRQDCFE